jgi:hypothetical protein
MSFNARDCKPTENDKNRFWSKVIKTDNCWFWVGGLTSAGYGSFKMQHQTFVTSRVAWVISHNIDIPQGLLVCHKCDNPVCVNPSHLFLGTNIDNYLDSYTKGRAKGRGCARLSDADVIAIRETYKEYGYKNGYGIGMKHLARIFGTTYSTIQRVIYKKHYNHTANFTPVSL